MAQSVAYRALPQAAKALLLEIEIEIAEQGGMIAAMNTDDICAASGLRKRALVAALNELSTAGFIVISMCGKSLHRRDVVGMEADMRPHRPSVFADALPVGRGHRLPMTLLHLTVRDHFLRAAAEIHCTGMSDRAAAAWLHTKLARYRECAWRRECAEEQCPPRHAGRVEALLWSVLKCSDRLVSERLIRCVLARSS
jgi:hypothetical protein